MKLSHPLQEVYVPNPCWLNAIALPVCEITQNTHAHFQMLLRGTVGWALVFGTWDKRSVSNQSDRGEGAKVFPRVVLEKDIRTSARPHETLEERLCVALSPACPVNADARLSWFPWQGILQGCNQMCAGYLFQPDKQYDVSYDTGDKAIQCGRHVDIFKFWLMWKAKVRRRAFRK